MELRDSVRKNWSTTGLELTKELKQFWQSSRPASPARGLGKNGIESAGESPGGIKTSSALAHLPRLDVPRHESPNRGPSSDFVTGYSLGLIGGVRSWVGSFRFLRFLLPFTFLQMTRTQKTLHGSQAGSPESDADSSDSKSPKAENTPVRGRHADRFNRDMEITEVK